MPESAVFIWAWSFVSATCLGVACQLVTGSVVVEILVFIGVFMFMTPFLHLVQMVQKLTDSK